MLVRRVMSEAASADAAQNLAERIVHFQPAGAETFRYWSSLTSARERLALVYATLLRVPVPESAEQMAEFLTRHSRALNNPAVTALLDLLCLPREPEGQVTPPVSLEACRAAVRDFRATPADGARVRNAMVWLLHPDARAAVPLVRIGPVAVDSSTPLDTVSAWAQHTAGEFGAGPLVTAYWCATVTAYHNDAVPVMANELDWADIQMYADDMAQLVRPREEACVLANAARVSYRWPFADMPLPQQPPRDVRDLDLSSRAHEADARRRQRRAELAAELQTVTAELRRLETELETQRLARYNAPDTDPKANAALKKALAQRKEFMKQAEKLNKDVKKSRVPLQNLKAKKAEVEASRSQLQLVARGSKGYSKASARLEALESEAKRLEQEAQRTRPEREALAKSAGELKNQLAAHEEHIKQAREAVKAGRKQASAVIEDKGKAIKALREQIDQASRQIEGLSEALSALEDPTGGATAEGDGDDGDADGGIAEVDDDAAAEADAWVGRADATPGSQRRTGAAGSESAAGQPFRLAWDQALRQWQLRSRNTGRFDPNQLKEFLALSAHVPTTATSLLVGQPRHTWHLNPRVVFRCCICERAAWMFWEPRMSQYLWYCGATRCELLGPASASHLSFLDSLFRGLQQTKGEVPKATDTVVASQLAQPFYVLPPLEARDRMQVRNQSDLLALYQATLQINAQGLLLSAELLMGRLGQSVFVEDASTLFAGWSLTLSGAVRAPPARADATTDVTLAPALSAEEAEFIAALRQQEEAHDTRTETEHKAALPDVPPELAQRLTLPEAHHDTLKRTHDAAELEAQQGNAKRAATAMAEEIPMPMEIEIKTTEDTAVAMETEASAAAAAASGEEKKEEESTEWLRDDVAIEPDPEEEYVAANGKRRRRRWTPFLVASAGHNAPPGTLVLLQEYDAVLSATYWEARLNRQRAATEQVKQSLDRYGYPIKVPAMLRHQQTSPDGWRPYVTDLLSNLVTAPWGEEREPLRVLMDAFDTTHVHWNEFLARYQRVRERFLMGCLEQWNAHLAGHGENGTNYRPHLYVGPLSVAMALRHSSDARLTLYEFARQRNLVYDARHEHVDVLRAIYAYQRAEVQRGIRRRLRQPLPPFHGFSPRRMFASWLEVAKRMKTPLDSEEAFYYELGNWMATLHLSLSYGSKNALDAVTEMPAGAEAAQSLDPRLLVFALAPGVVCRSLDQAENIIDAARDGLMQEELAHILATHPADPATVKWVGSELLDFVARKRTQPDLKMWDDPSEALPFGVVHPTGSSHTLVVDLSLLRHTGCPSVKAALWLIQYGYRRYQADPQFLAEREEAEAFDVVQSYSEELALFHLRGFGPLHPRVARMVVAAGVTVCVAQHSKWKLPFAALGDALDTVRHVPDCAAVAATQPALYLERIRAAAGDPTLQVRGEAWKPTLSAMLQGGEEHKGLLAFFHPVGIGSETEALAVLDAASYWLRQTASWWTDPVWNIRSAAIAPALREILLHQDAVAYGSSAQVRQALAANVFARLPGVAVEDAERDLVQLLQTRAAIITDTLGRAARLSNKIVVTHIRLQSTPKPLLDLHALVRPLLPPTPEPSFVNYVLALGAIFTSERAAGLWLQSQRQNLGAKVPANLEQALVAPTPPSWTPAQLDAVRQMTPAMALNLVSRFEGTAALRKLGAERSDIPSIVRAECREYITQLYAISRNYRETMQRLATASGAPPYLSTWYLSARNAQEAQATTQAVRWCMDDPSFKLVPTRLVRLIMRRILARVEPRRLKQRIAEAEDEQERTANQKEVVYSDSDPDDEVLARRRVIRRMKAPLRGTKAKSLEERVREDRLRQLRIRKGEEDDDEDEQEIELKMEDKKYDVWEKATETVGLTEAEAEETAAANKQGDSFDPDDYRRVGRDEADDEEEAMEEADIVELKPRKPPKAKKPPSEAAVADATTSEAALVNQAAQQLQALPPAAVAAAGSEDKAEDDKDDEDEGPEYEEDPDKLYVNKSFQVQEGPELALEAAESKGDGLEALRLFVAVSERDYLDEELEDPLYNTRHKTDPVLLCNLGRGVALHTPIEWMHWPDAKLKLGASLERLITERLDELEPIFRCRAREDLLSFGLTVAPELGPTLEQEAVAVDLQQTWVAEPDKWIPAQLFDRVVRAFQRILDDARSFVPQEAEAGAAAASADATDLDGLAAHLRSEMVAGLRSLVTQTKERAPELALRNAAPHHIEDLVRAVSGSSLPTELAAALQRALEPSGLVLQAVSKLSKNWRDWTLAEYRIRQNDVVQPLPEHWYQRIRPIHADIEKERQAALALWKGDLTRRREVDDARLEADRRRAEAQAHWMRQLSAHLTVGQQSTRLRDPEARQQLMLNYLADVFQPTRVAMSLTAHDAMLRLAQPWFESVWCTIRRDHNSGILDTTERDVEPLVFTGFDRVMKPGIDAARSLNGLVRRMRVTNDRSMAWDVMSVVRDVASQEEAAYRAEDERYSTQFLRTLEQNFQTEGQLVAAFAAAARQTIQELNLSRQTGRLRVWQGLHKLERDFQNYLSRGNSGDGDEASWLDRAATTRNPLQQLSEDALTTRLRQVHRRAMAQVAQTETLDAAVEAFTRAVAIEFYSDGRDARELLLASSLREALDDPTYDLERLLTQNALFYELRRNIYPLAFPDDPAVAPPAQPAGATTAAAAATPPVGLRELVMNEERLLHCMEIMELYGNPATRNRVPPRVRSYHYIENLFESYTHQRNHAQLITATGLVSRQRLDEVTRIAALARAARILLYADNKRPPSIPSRRPEAGAAAAATSATVLPNAARATPKPKTKPGNKVGGPSQILSPPPPLCVSGEAWMEHAVSGIATLARNYGMV